MKTWLAFWYGIFKNNPTFRLVLGLAINRPLADFWKGTQPNCCAHVVTLAGGVLSLKARAVVFG